MKIKALAPWFGGKRTRERLGELAKAIDIVSAMPHYTVGDSIKRVLRLLELCPWIEAAAEEPMRAERG